MRMTPFNSTSKENKKKRKQNNRIEEDEETMTYLTRKPAAFLNERGTVFKGIGEDSFHLAPSVFDRQAIFHTADQEKK